MATLMRIAEATHLTLTALLTEEPVSEPPAYPNGRRRPTLFLEQQAPSTTPRSNLRIRGRVGQLSIQQGGLHADVAEALTHGGQADAAVDELGGVRMT